MAKKELSLVERAERMQRRRTRILWAQGVLFLIWQGSYWSSRHELSLPLRAVEQVRLSAQVFWVAALLMLLTTGGGLLRERNSQVRAMANDEVTRAHRRSAFTWGYWVLILGCLSLYVISLFEPLGLVDVVHGLLSVGVVVPIMRFVWLESRAERHG